jgi:dTDP-4-amino-4,6-dideoxygalactose transaminase
MFRIPLSQSFVHPRALPQVALAAQSGNLAGSGAYAQACERRLGALTGAAKTLLTPSATAALELAALALKLRPGDEVVLPAYTFPSTANVVALRGAVPVFCDVRPDTLNVGVDEIAACLTPKTRAVIVVHYAGNPVDMPPIVECCRQHGLGLVEDAAQALGASLHGTPAGRFGDLGALSFHGSKNLGCGEGGALLVNLPGLGERAEVQREKGTDRARFLRGEVERYAWQDIGSSYVVSELVAAFLDAQLQAVDSVTEGRREAWHRYHLRMAAAESAGLLRRPLLTPGGRHNGHIYWVLLKDAATRQRVSAELAAQGIEATRHYVPLHNAPAGLRLGRTPRVPRVTEEVAERLLRLPLWHDIGEGVQDEVVTRLLQVLAGRRVRPARVLART